jgi:ketosteroid isomerase-like protein
MQSWAATKLTEYLMARLRAGDPGPTNRLDAPDVTLTFPGQNSWSGQFRGKDEVRRWRQRLVAAGIQIFPDEVVAVGPPWHTRLLIRGHDHAFDDSGATVYDNRYVIWARLRWGRLKEYEVYEDTEKANTYDAWLAEHRPEVRMAA